MATTNLPVLLTGESGTGKEVVASSLHSHSSRAEQPFVAVNCGAISAELIESELFGHVKGSFTAGRFRKDLFYRLHAVSIRLPPLRERPEDILLLAKSFAERVYSRDSFSYNSWNYFASKDATNSVSFGVWYTGGGARVGQRSLSTAAIVDAEILKHASRRGNLHSKIAQVLVACDPLQRIGHEQLRNLSLTIHQRCEKLRSKYSRFVT